MNKTFYHQTVTTKQIENYISKQSGIDFSKVFDQYLRLHKYRNLNIIIQMTKKLYYHWDSCVAGFNLRLVINKDNKTLTLQSDTTMENIEVG